MNNIKNNISKRIFWNSLSRVKMLTELRIPLPSNFKMRQDPIILLGMHRSGTSLLSKILGQFGIHMGNRLGKLNETNFFLDIDILLLELFHGFWDYPLSMENIFQNNSKAIKNINFELRNWINSYRFYKNYVGIRNFKKFYLERATPWGWKNPRSTVTWPFWFDVFKSPKFIFIYRNGIDVAESLRKAERLSEKYIGSRHSSLRATTLNGAFKIWEEYHKVYFGFKENFPSAKIIEICYEDLLLDPIKKLNEINDFAKINVDPNLINKLSKNINSTRRFSFLKNDKLYKFYEKKLNNFWLNKLGYNLERIHSEKVRIP
jgi:hypothetical protein